MEDKNISDEIANTTSTLLGYTIPADETRYRRQAALDLAINFARDRELSGAGVVELAAKFDKFLENGNANS